MKRKGLQIGLVLMALLIVVLVVVAFGFMNPAQSPGQIELSATEFHFGTIPNSEPVSQAFEVRNVGPSWLEITGVSTSCACTTAEIDDHRLAPGEVTDLTVTYDPQVHDGETGDFVRQVYIRSNDPATPEARLTIRVTVVQSRAIQIPWTARSAQ
ncbi:MAG: DUF1573 domain-containing protein [Anaerolineae bacterium]|nr:DUF1573 domain-containing protein [Anaerolineae bacterium]NIN97070.1 DUF1573 domain-containing protein [Anaerolineae bacterium]NIQ80019.1 DUF1573 domain-containing protein [Anaerolineae bacterium]